MASSHILLDGFSDSVIDTRGPRWSQVTRYWPTVMWSAGSVLPSEWSLFGVNLTEAELHDKYIASYGLAASRKYPTPSTARRLSAYTHRLSQSEDTIVVGEFRLENITGGASNVFRSPMQACLGARITGEAGTEFTVGAGHAEMLQSPSGYYFVAMTRRVSGSRRDIRFALVKVIGPGTAGGQSTITELAGVIDPLDASDLIGVNDNFALRFSCITNAGVVELRGYYTDRITGLETLKVSHDEGTGGLTESGHALLGVMTELENDSGGGGQHGIIMGVRGFEIQDGASAIVMRDEFDRVNITSARQAGDDAFFSTGEAPSFLVSGMFTGDQSSEELTGELPFFGDRMVREASSAKLDVDSDPEGGYHLFYQPPTSIYAQGVSILVDFSPGGGVLLRRAGVAVRRALGENNPHEDMVSGVESTGYTLAVHYVDSVFTLRLHRYSGGNHTEIASRVLNGTGDPVTVALGTAFTLRCDIENRNGANVALGNVHLTPTIDATLLTGWTLPVSRIVEEDDGTLTDTNSARVLSGGATGFFADNLEGGTGGGEIFIENAQQVAVTVPVSELEQGSVSIPTEKGNKSGTFTTPHEWEVEVMYEDYSEAHDLDSAHVHRHGTASSQRRRWKVHSDAALKLEADGLRTFFLAHGTTVPFDWTTPSGEALVASQEEDSLKIQKIDFKVYSFAVILVEMLGA